MRRRTEHASNDAPLSFDSIAGYVATIKMRSGDDAARTAAKNFERNLGWDAAKLWQAAQDMTRAA